MLELLFIGLFLPIISIKIIRTALAWIGLQ